MQQSQSPSLRPVIEHAGSREVAWLGSSVDVRLSAAQSGGQLGVWTCRALRGASAPMHVHHREDEQFLVVSGTVRFRIGELDVDAAAGDLVFLPRDVPHTYLVTSDEATFVGSVTPAGFERFFTDLGVPMAEAGSIGEGPSVPAMVAALSELGVDVVGPPLSA